MLPTSSLFQAYTRISCWTGGHARFKRMHNAQDGSKELDDAALDRIDTLKKLTFRYMRRFRYSKLGRRAARFTYSIAKRITTSIDSFRHQLLWAQFFND